jgi:hypothetical protein
VTCLPGEGTIDFLADLADKDTFDITARRAWKSEALDLPEHGLHPDDSRADVLTDPLFHLHFSKKQSPRPHRDLGLWVTNLWPQSVSGV